jgi:hypothetical protein
MWDPRRTCCIHATSVLLLSVLHTGAGYQVPVTELVQGQSMDKVSENDLVSLEQPDSSVGPAALVHITKCGGSTLDVNVRPYFTNDIQWIDGHPNIRDAFQNTSFSEYIYFVRSPVRRYVSGWISRFREGMPTYHVPWHEPYETEAFHRFASPNEMAAALSSDNSTRRQEAKQAMVSIGHVRDSLMSYYGDMENFERCLGLTTLVGSVEHYDEDYARLVHYLADNNKLTEDIPDHVEEASHVRPDKFDEMEHLEPQSVRNLQEWYQDDYTILERLEGAGFLPSGYVAEIQETDFDW